MICNQQKEQIEQMKKEQEERRIEFEDYKRILARVQAQIDDRSEPDIRDYYKLNTPFVPKSNVQLTPMKSPYERTLRAETKPLFPLVVTQDSSNSDINKKPSTSIPEKPNLQPMTGLAIDVYKKRDNFKVWLKKFEVLVER